MLRLASATAADWAPRAAQMLLPEILLDHAHLEKRAAAAAVGLMFRYPERAALMPALARLAKEELSHFEEVFHALEVRGIAYTRQRPSAYAERLAKISRRGEPERLLDALLVAAFIEARSCERMGLLAEHLADPALAKLYRGLLVAEARHHATYVDLALKMFPQAEVRARLAEVGNHEADVLADLPREPRLHSN